MDTPIYLCFLLFLFFSASLRISRVFKLRKLGEHHFAETLFTRMMLLHEIAMR